MLGLSLRRAQQAQLVDVGSMLRRSYLVACLIIHASARAPKVASRRHEVARATPDADRDALRVPAAGNPREDAAPAQQGETPANIRTLVSQARRLVRLSIPRP